MLSSCVFSNTQEDTFLLFLIICFGLINKVCWLVLEEQENGQFWFCVTEELYFIVWIVFQQFKLIMSTQKNITLKYLVVGDSGVGKTSLLVRYCEDTFQADYLSTIGVDFKIKRVEMNGCNVTLNIWDTAGQQRFRNITKSFYKGAHGIILTYSITDPTSFSHIQTWIDQIREVGNADTDMILVATKTDMQYDRKVTRKQGETLAEKYNLKFVQTSAKGNDNISKVFEELTGDIILRLGKEDRLNESKQGINTNLGRKKQESKKSDCC